MKTASLLKRIVGILFIITAASSLALCVFGIVQVWRVRPEIQKIVDSNLTLLSKALDVTDAALLTAQGTIDSVKQEAISLQTTLDALAKAIHESNPTLTSVSSLLELDIPDTITSAQTALTSASKSAKLIDDFLAAITTLPFSPLKSYKPAVPLSTALVSISDSLDPLPTAMSTINQNIANNQETLVTLETEITGFAESITLILLDLDEVTKVIQQYQEVVGSLQGRIASFVEASPNWVMALAWILTILLAWLMVAQLAMFTQGLDMMRAEKSGG